MFLTAILTEKMFAPMRAASSEVLGMIEFPRDTILRRKRLPVAQHSGLIMLSQSFRSTASR